MIKDLEKLQDHLHDIQQNSKYRYINALHSRYGIMICSVCGGKITGQYRNEGTPEYQVNTHRECCPDDPYWEKMDEFKNARSEAESSLEREVEVLKSKYGYLFDDFMHDYFQNY